ncbi:hypothetical protein QBC35DRAFT_375487 [Podospora australis]|uniref:Glycoside hydrolase subgroup catalytic core n=1 Tax=Podospora australis TaxID=1536484 RepID=A0AAN6X5E8_9PEZI|nr:hypothetical protein QBC35DRAFT_375487 [Podospora australis]
MIWPQVWRAWAVAASIATAVHSQQTGNNPDWPRWCGKVYEAGYPNFDPGGQTLPPVPVTGAPLLHVQFQPRYSLYLDSEKYGEFVVNAELSQFHGTSPWPATNSTTKWANRLIFSINLVFSDDPLVQATVLANSTGNVFRFELSRLGKPSLSPIKVSLYGAPENGTPVFQATTTMLYLPDKKSGSVTRIDNLKGGLWFKNSASNQTFEPFLPYGFYASHDGFLRNNNTAEIQAYADLGLNAMVPLTIYKDSPDMLAYMDKINLRFMYNLREGYKNLSYVRENVLSARDAESVFAYWSSDEPDGWQDPFTAPHAAHDLIKSLDPYHPVAITLNCQNYYFAEYSAAADFIMEDVYPIGINATWSKWGTECNITHGDCGCDNCEGTIQDVPDRLDTLATYEKWLGLWPKTKFHNPQSFHGQDYWLRDPTVGEEHAMNVLAFNHGARGVISWVWPTSGILGKAHGELATVVTKPPVRDFIVGGGNPERIEVPVQWTEVVDAAYWVHPEDQRRVLVGVVNGGYVGVTERVEVELVNATKIEKVVWGDVKWKLEAEKLVVEGTMPALATSFVIVNLRAGWAPT